jgi:DNA-binding PadR family transcriptional regulator
MKTLRGNRPIEWLALRILEHLCRFPGSAYTVNRLMRIRGLGWQRRDRVKRVLRVLASLGWVEERTSNGRTFYQVTKHGLEAYLSFGHWLFDLVEALRFEHSNAPRNRCERAAGGSRG